MGWSTESPRLRLVALSFLMLFLELALIRWVGSNVLYLSYFSNFILLASFLGIGLGFLRANSGRDLLRFAPIALAALVGFVRLFPVEIDRSGTELIFFGALGTRTGLPPFITLPLLFLGVAGVMMLVGEGVARTFRQFPPLEAYRLDILGSLAGIIAFSLLGFLEAPPVVWGAVVAVGLFMLIDRRSALWQVPALAIMLTVLGLESVVATDSWSPYYKIRLIPQPSGAITLLVNGIPHQTIEAASRKLDVVSIYGIPYTRMRATPNDVLIVGAGTGDDVAIALRLGARHVDAVEIDPRIHAIGVQLNPDRAFQDPRVTSFVNDGRAFLEQTTRRYDLILFALPDSLTLVAGQSSLRLESYLFTAEAMQAARRHLTPEGAFGEYNYYREQWLIDRLAGTLQQVYGRAPCVDSVGEFGRLAVLMASSSATALQCPTTWQPASPTTPPPATDDYPFLYLQARTIPDFYLLTLALILGSALLLVRLSAGTLRPMGRYLDLFCMGAAFLLLETKNVVQFALLFGTTWFVNSLVFVGILLAVYLAIEVARRVDLGPSWRLYLALLVALAVAWLVQPELLLTLAVVPRFVAAIVIAFAPVFLANLVFARRFRDVSASNLAFAANLLGAMVGGVLEYASLLTGYRALLILIALLYAGAFALQRFQARRLVRLA
ncbi:MAG: spermidine synthase [Chloroflexi bacterium]|nr:MAG: spermidine synthase [Chloroflexota bacterium]